ncbi:MAG TPA: response regulator [Dehalococcoidia bacterium]|nr:response regulator [Dehalococcoidia bacterium]
MTERKVLVVDDDPDILDVISLILESQGYEVIVARDGVECLNKLREAKPTLMILDLLMPKMDGFAVYKELQSPEWSEYRDIPILILSSVREEASRRRYELETGRQLDVDEYLEKPISPEALLGCVAKLLERKERV